ncbi:MAG: J domain-containing protein [Symploca sp. SIO3C6]|uniref:J domain-containing protein n=1 Tax=Symploca sp. SIO1C4 TaxID=2607765 RepID=A0A6B3NDR5_9CYAN|nr:J domain-containing protein [Symploca sp. SIO3C6]NER29045.1 J domain-containing protein [Symploca sp. SIO1C4]NET05047.1 J domain-containing protein [Symploca sp. SIO2B6]NET52562.1 J domain-containing protein [Merismopedia sp. SIO2A8]
MAQKRVRQTIKEHVIPNSTGYYALLGLHPSASPIEIRRAYRELSKRYHPDTTNLPNTIATAKFQELNQAYATLSNPERRTAYDHKIGYSRFNVISPYPGFKTPVAETRRTYSPSAYLDPTDRPLSTGEIFALFILGLTFLGCLLLAIAIGLTRGESAVQLYGINNQELPKPKLINESKTKEMELKFHSSSDKPSSVSKAPEISQ